jgi:hypothetical protein
MQLPVDVVAHVGDTERMLGARCVAGDHPGAHRLDARHAGEQPRIERELNEEAGPRAARELGVEHIVVPIAECGGAGHAAQEIGMPQERVVAQGGLVDDVDAGAHRGECCFDLIREACCAPQAAVGLDLDDACMAGLECREEGQLVGNALLLDQGRLCVVGGLGTGGVEVEQVEGRAVCAAEELHEVRCGMKHLLVDTLRGVSFGST